MQVREATRSTKMNQIMLIFTIATILYLPPTFVAVSDQWSQGGRKRARFQK